MRWYDYIAVFWFANQIAVGFLYLNMITLLFGVLGYKIYEDYRIGKY